jgi:hypothetical protein
MKKLVFLFVFLSFVTLQAQDTADVEYTFTITDEFNNSQDLIIGKDPFGSDGLDPEFGEVIVPQVPTGQFGARLILPTDSTLSTLKDIRFGCEWIAEIEHNIDLSYATGSNHMNINWDWNMPLLSVQFYNPYNGNLIQSFEHIIDSSFFNVPDGLDKIKMIVQYNVPLSGEWFSVINPNGGDTLFVGETHIISWAGHKMSPCIEIEFTSDGGNSWSFIQDTFCLNQLYYQWTVPNIPSDSCRIRVGHYPCAYDTSDTYFSIVQITPVELLTFSSSVYENDVTLSWATATETNNSGFEIQKLKDSKIEKLQDWEMIGFVNGHGTTTESQTYSFVDENISTGKYQYRLKQIDFDGTFEYSNTIETEILPPAKFSLEQNFPNPFNPTTTIKWQTPKEAFQTLKVFDVLGNEVATLISEVKLAGLHQIEFDASTLASGIYYYQLRTDDNVQTKKMIFIK